MRLLSASLLACALVAGGACDKTKMASTAQCERIRDRYVDLRLSEDPAAARMTTEDRAYFRGKLAAQVLSEPDVAKVNERCLAAVTEAEYDCAVKAPTAKAWNDCIR